MQFNQSSARYKEVWSLRVNIYAIHSSSKASTREAVQLDVFRRSSNNSRSFISRWWSCRVYGM